MTGICAVCGPTTAREHRVDKKYVVYLCGKKYSHSTPHIWKSQIFSLYRQQTHRQMIDDFKLERGCQNCGCIADPLELELHFSGVDERQYSLSRLVLFGRTLLHASESVLYTV
jgi:hypothetical protein